MKKENFYSRYFTWDDPIIRDFSYGSLYAEFYNRGWWSRVYEYEWAKNVAIDFFGNISDKTAIDIATGIQHPNIFIMKKAGFFKVVGTDVFDKKDFYYVKHLDGNTEYINDDLLNPKIEDKFDCVSCISMIEHLHPDEQIIAIRNLMHYLKPKGCLIVTFDMPGFEYKTDLCLYKKILSDSGFTCFYKDVREQDIVKTSKCDNAEKSLKKLDLSCYRMFAFR